MIAISCPCCQAPLQLSIVTEGQEKKLELKAAEAPKPKADRDLIMELVDGAAEGGE